MCQWYLLCLQSCGREIESREGVGREVAFKTKNCAYVYTRAIEEFDTLECQSSNFRMFFFLVIDTHLHMTATPSQHLAPNHFCRRVTFLKNRIVTQNFMLRKFEKRHQLFNQFKTWWLVLKTIFFCSKIFRCRAVEIASQSRKLLTQYPNSTCHYLLSNLKNGGLGKLLKLNNT
jgi:hypothetical protein